MANERAYEKSRKKIEKYEEDARMVFEQTLLITNCKKHSYGKSRVSKAGLISRRDCTYENFR